MTQRFDDRPQQIEQRSGFQFRLIELNIAVYGVIAAFALSDPGFWDVLLIAPVISFMLFLLWIHHGIAIRQMNWPLGASSRLWSGLRFLTVILVLGANFIVAPIAAVLLHDVGYKNVPTELLRFADLYVIPISAGILLIGWSYLQYIRKKDPRERHLGSNAAVDEPD